MKEPSRFRFLFATLPTLLLPFGGGIVSVAFAQNAEEISWKTGPEFRQALTEPLGLTWNSTPISKILPLLEKQTGTAIWVDRRIDANLPLTFSAQETTIPELLLAVARETTGESAEFLNPHVANLGVSQTGSFLYVGPETFARRLRTLVNLKKDELKSELPPTAQKNWLKEKAVSWERLSEPQKLLKELAEERNLKIRGLKSVPHDLWPARSLPPTSALELALLILGQFDLTLNFNDSGAEVIPLKLKSVVVTKSYSASQISSEKRRLIEKERPETRFTEKGKKILVCGILEVHEFLASGASAKNGLSPGAFPAPRQSRPSPARSNAASLENQRLSGKIQGPFLPFVVQLCQQKGLKLTMDETAFHEKGINLQTNIQLEVKNATVEETFQKMAEEIGAHAKIEGDRLILTP